ncbi:hypothetical protein BLNAU_12625 [Blattamonas nauphoetae]|uniref:Uncharacterized protein n=1 Tax=Blattamonas nauphoetae TaxID=2049346 RepID=A0ABQ9XIV7_9EUKA|nr:hypothetical protein BLNAU_12625 [Blattamonas nauphoetae]
MANPLRIFNEKNLIVSPDKSETKLELKYSVATCTNKNFVSSIVDVLFKFVKSTHPKDLEELFADNDSLLQEKISIMKEKGFCIALEFPSVGKEKPIQYNITFLCNDKDGLALDDVILRLVAFLSSREGIMKSVAKLVCSRPPAFLDLFKSAQNYEITF